MDETQQDDQAMVDAQKLLENCQGKLIVVEQENANLKTALGTARRIGAALGILMATRKITDDQAFAVLSGISQATNRKIRDIAEDVILTGHLA